MADENNNQSTLAIPENGGFVQRAKAAIGWLTGAQKTERIFAYNDPFDFSKSISKALFIEYALENIYRKILTDCYAKSQGISDKNKVFYWDSVVKSWGKSAAGAGLITMLSKCMAKKADLFLTFKESVLREANSSEQKEIENGFKNKDNKAAVSNGFWFSFTDYTLTDILKVLYLFQYLILASAHTGMNVAKAVQLKIHELRNTIAYSEKDQAAEQAIAIMSGLKSGKAVLLDALDKIENAAVDMKSTETAIAFVNNLISFYLNMPLSYINGQLTTGISTTGESDNIAVERGLEAFFNSIFKPVSDEIFKSDLSFVSDNWRVLQSGAVILQTMSMLDDNILALDIKRNVVNAIFKDFIPTKKAGK
ncbi:MAG: hypothetical protein LBV16_09295 [Elusimicrobiota bacterium]|jgi:hypothetical protein|nr:hypothetical protein [Elusimicrobiota bacterium]